MGEGRGNVEELIKNCFDEIKPSQEYNEILLKKLKKEENIFNNNIVLSSIRKKSYSTGLSLILTGFLMIFMYTSNMPDTILNLQFKIRSIVCQIKYNGDENIIKFLGGWFSE
ncbi:hypothetical protein [Clostridium lundense]|uniref:hypothetical protein n=1 Tax=Clostridium lundense TaxID=319475 RepID=UPI0004879564|nr:hypothetical protein [Clostridium lundense]